MSKISFFKKQVGRTVRIIPKRWVVGRIYEAYDNLKEPYRFFAFFMVFTPLVVAAQFEPKIFYVIALLIITRFIYLEDKI